MCCGGFLDFASEVDDLTGGKVGVLWLVCCGGGYDDERGLREC